MNKEALKDAYAILVGVPEPHFLPRLQTFYYNPDIHGYSTIKRAVQSGHTCGTQGCVAGILSLHPLYPLKGNPPEPYARWSLRNFGVGIGRDSRFVDLFGPKEHSKFDYERSASRMSGKTLGLYRILRMLDEYTPRQARLRAIADT